MKSGVGSKILPFRQDVVNVRGIGCVLLSVCRQGLVIEAVKVYLQFASTQFHVRCSWPILGLTRQFLMASFVCQGVRSDFMTSMWWKHKVREGCVSPFRVSSGAANLLCTFSRLWVFPFGAERSLVFSHISTQETHSFSGVLTQSHAQKNAWKKERGSLLVSSTEKLC